MSYFTISSDKIFSNTIIIKKSSFITFLQKISSVEQAQNILSAIRKQYPDARHVCYVYCIGSINSPTSIKMSDDGEPQGSAAKPIFNALQFNNVGDVIAIVVRYFGGIKLGFGGLVRAYSNAVVDVLQLAPLQEFIEQESYQIELEYIFLDGFNSLLKNYSLSQPEYVYTDKVAIKFLLHKEFSTEFFLRLTELTKGKFLLI